jgi:hypothetical protein
MIVWKRPGSVPQSNSSGNQNILLAKSRGMAERPRAPITPPIKGIQEGASTFRTKSFQKMLALYAQNGTEASIKTPPTIHLTINSLEDISL